MLWVVDEGEVTAFTENLTLQRITAFLIRLRRQKNFTLLKERERWKTQPKHHSRHMWAVRSQGRSWSVHTMVSVIPDSGNNPRGTSDPNTQRCNCLFHLHTGLSDVHMRCTAVNISYRQQNTYSQTSQQFHEMVSWWQSSRWSLCTSSPVIILQAVNLSNFTLCKSLLSDWPSTRRAHKTGRVIGSFQSSNHMIFNDITACPARFQTGLSNTSSYTHWRHSQEISFKSANEASSSVTLHILFVSLSLPVMTSSFREWL